MNVQTFFGHVNSAYRGSDDNPPTVGTPDYTLWLNSTNRKIDEWARDTKNVWRSLFDIRSIGTVAAGTQDYSLDDDFLNPSDKVFVTSTTGQVMPVTLCEPQERDRYYQSAYIHGSPDVLTFGQTLTSTSPLVGGAITVPGYYLPALVTGATSTIPVDDPFWLVYEVAADLAANEQSYEDKAVAIQAKADKRYNVMAQNNRRGSNDNPRQLRTQVNAIPDTRTNRIGNLYPRNTY